MKVESESDSICMLGRKEMRQCLIQQILIFLINIFVLLTEYRGLFRAAGINHIIRDRVYIFKKTKTKQKQA